MGEMFLVFPSKSRTRDSQEEHAHMERAAPSVVGGPLFPAVPGGQLVTIPRERS